MNRLGYYYTVVVAALLVVVLSSSNSSSSSTTTATTKSKWSFQWYHCARSLSREGTDRAWHEMHISFDKQVATVVVAAVVVVVW